MDDGDDDDGNGAAKRRNGVEVRDMMSNGEKLRGSDQTLLPAPLAAL